MPKSAAHPDGQSDGIQAGKQRRGERKGNCLARIINVIKSGEFSHDATQVHEFLSTCFVVAKMSRRDDVYQYVGEAAECFLSMLQRRRERNTWAATGDEIKTLATHMDTMAEALGALPESTIKLAMARAELELRAVRHQMRRERH